MPAIVTHHLFGEDAYGALAPIIGESDAQRDAFLLGNQGPDPLLCLKALPSRADYRTIGTVMHTSAPTELFASLHWRFVATPETDKSPGSERKAFALGFLCHYLLDSLAHPLVFAQQYAYCDAGIPGLGRDQGSIVHALIETELDEYELTTRRDMTVGSFSPHNEILTREIATLNNLSWGISAVAAEAYGINVPLPAFALSVNLYRAAQAGLDSKRDGLRRIFDYGRVAGKAYARIQAMTHADAPRLTTPFANNEHTSWPHPFEQGKTLSASFDDLYEAAMQQALSLIPQFARPDFSVRDCATLTSNVNFHGQIV